MPFMFHGANSLLLQTGPKLDPICLPCIIQHCSIIYQMNILETKYQRWFLFLGAGTVFHLSLLSGSCYKSGGFLMTSTEGSNTSLLDCA